MLTNYTARKAKGYMRLFGPGNVTDKEYDSLQCVHCDGHWIVEPNSGKHRGWCMNCGGPHCGEPACWTCIPFERKLAESFQKARLLETITERA